MGRCKYPSQWGYSKHCIRQLRRPARLAVVIIMLRILSCIRRALTGRWREKMGTFQNTPYYKGVADQKEAGSVQWFSLPAPNLALPDERRNSYRANAAILLHKNCHGRIGIAHSVRYKVNELYWTSPFAIRFLPLYSFVSAGHWTVLWANGAYGS